jgi:hypothetical protein
MIAMLSRIVLGEGASDWSLNSLLSHPDTVVPLGICTVVIVLIVAKNWLRVAQVHADAELKQSMIQRGMSPEEIERVLESKSPKTW